MHSFVLGLGKIREMGAFAALLGSDREGRGKACMEDRFPRLGKSLTTKGSESK